MSSYEFTPPDTMAEAENKIASIGLQITDVCAQLGQGEFRDVTTGELANAEKTKLWRKRALWKKRCLEMELGHLKIWLKERRDDLKVMRFSIDAGPLVFHATVQRYLKMVPDEMRDPQWHELVAALDVLTKRSL